MTPEQCKALLQEQERIKRQVESTVQQVARENMPGYHFLDYRVSTFWECEKSPLGMCVFVIHDINGRGVEGGCKFCGQKSERK